MENLRFVHSKWYTGQKKYELSYLGYSYHGFCRWWKEDGSIFAHSSYVVGFVHGIEVYFEY